MQVRDSAVTLSATDLANHLSCRHLTTLDYRLAKGELTEPAWENPHLIVLRQRGIDHEKAYVDMLRDKGLTVVDLSNEPDEAATWAAMQSGSQAIVQASLAGGGWRGRADVLLRVERPSHLGEWSYEVVDCKLTRSTKAETILQLCFYSELLAELQGAAPEMFHVIRPYVDFIPESYRFASFAAYYRVVKGALRGVMDAGNADTYPEPVSHCDICRWWKHCDRQRRSDDHLSFVAGASKLQRSELAEHGVATLEALGRLTVPLPFNPSRGGREGYVRIREQARVQLEARIAGQLKFELLDCAPAAGLGRLPLPSEGDIFLDLEGDPFAGQGGIEYLFGIVTLEHGRLTYQGRWALDRAQEKAAFEWFIDFTHERRARFGGLHVYHFGGYEPGAMKRLMLRYATREEELDRLLRGEVFVDLHTIVKQGVRASVEQYSLKELEKLCGFSRIVPLPEANQARHLIEHQLELSPAPARTDASCQIVAGYNEDDCRATERLHAWLEGLRSPDLPRPAAKDTAPSEERSAHRLRVAALFDSLTHDLPPEPKDRTPEQAARWLLAHALDWHGREEKVKWWEFFRMKDLAEADLYDEKSVLAGLSFQQRLPKRPRERSATDRYEYPPQECSIRDGDDIFTFDEQKFGEVVATDPTARTIDIKKPGKRTAEHPASVFAHSHYGTREHANSILRIADWIVANGMDAPGEFRAARDLLLRNPPRLAGGRPFDARETAAELVCALDHSVLPMQGPPGAGKTYTGARMICELVRCGKRIGVTAVSHKVISNLLDEVAKAALDTGVAAVACGFKGEGGLPTNEEALRALQSGAVNVLGGTSWLWSREEFMNSVDVLFVDEAGQMSLANVLACAPAGRSLVLLGDPQQLEQPQKGSHPEGSDVSALAQLLDGRATIAEEQGLFLAETYRMHPAICTFTSEMFYEGRLASRAGLDRQQVIGPAPYTGAGLWFVPVAHEGNQSYSTEEVDRVAGLVESLTQSGMSWIDGDGMQNPIRLDDIRIVAPFNDQVNRLADRLPGARIGTVDKFQGQQAAVVIYSMTASTPEDAPRGMEFLYNLNRFNVATSRARCVCVVVGSPRLLAPECRTPRQMELANALCRYVEMSRQVVGGTRVADG